jgi:signal transduction histidine kinase
MGVAQEGGRLSIWVKDNGCGMDLQTREQIFELFFSSKAGKGTGFGLFITHSIVTRHQGTIRVDSLPGKGAGFFICLPLISAEDLSGNAGH